MAKRGATQQPEPMCSSDGQTEFDKTEHAEPAKRKQEALCFTVLDDEVLHKLCIMVGKFGIDAVLERLEPIEREYGVRS